MIFKNIIRCPNCLSNLKDTGGRFYCEKCQKETFINDNIISWNSNIKLRDQSFFEKIKNNSYTFQDYIDKIITLFHPLFGRFSPLGILHKRKVEIFYKKTLSSQTLSNDWFNNYFKNLRLSKKSNVLDLGCGRGRNVALLKLQNFNVYGQDIYFDKWWLKLKENCYFQIVNGNENFLPYKSNSFDLVLTVMINGFFHDKKFKKQIEEIYRILKPKQYWFVLESNPYSYSAKANMRYYGNRTRSKEEVKKILNNNRWTILNEWYEGYNFKYLPGTVDFFRFLFSKNPDISDYKNSLIFRNSDKNKPLWGFLLQKTK